MSTPAPVISKALAVVRFYQVTIIDVLTVLNTGKSVVSRHLQGRLSGGPLVLVMVDDGGDVQGRQLLILLMMMYFHPFLPQ